MGYSPWGRKESDTTERLHFHFLFIKVLKLIELNVRHMHIHINRVSFTVCLLFKNLNTLIQKGPGD